MLLRHTKLLFISGLIWCAAGLLLFMKGINFLQESINADISTGKNLPLLDFMAPYVQDPNQIMLMIGGLALLIGFFKGKVVLKKSAMRGIVHISNLPDPAPLSRIYSAKTYVILGLMMGIGMSMKYLGVPTDVRGFIDMAIGFALIQGASFYFKALAMKTAV